MAAVWTPSTLSNAAGQITLGFNNAEFTVPTAADQCITRTVTCTTGAEVYEPDINSYDSEGTQANVDGGSVSMDTAYAVALQNNDASINVTYSFHSDLGSHGGTLTPGETISFINVTGWTLTASSTITLTAASGSPTVDIVVIGKNA